LRTLNLSATGSPDRRGIAEYKINAKQNHLFKLTTDLPIAIGTQLTTQHELLEL